ncbi:ATP-binding protein [Nonomuraea soli]|uniref:Tetratricopeptide (TPR) repeat protein n=1 Tax=Nonomuraea soli TaxID=1032476 RepID=A0A7W0CGV6_9ACTN|nr:helix-turn-helix domain-containing protein [Nonomuraea soli]MBA2890914.1 tetratricopeptide (TPR) repeat protein [Nonomuraea soli]
MAEAFGEVLRGMRHAAGLTIEELSHASGVSVRAIGDMERGASRGPQRRTVQALAEALRLDETRRARLAEAARAGRPRQEAVTPGACELPRGVGDFTGRTRELGLLRELAGQDAAVAAIQGTAGIGKTALAVRAAAHLAGLFPDGCFYLDLRGMDEAPPDPAAALSRLLKALGVAERRIPAHEEERAGHYRALLRERRCLIILDNAAHEGQVRPLLPSGGPAMTVVTSRRPLAGLEGVRQIPLTHLALEESAELLGGIVGAERAQADPEGVARVASLCGNLPLALRIAGNRLQSRPGWTPRQLADLLSDEGRRVESLSAGDLSVATAFALSYRQLSVPARRSFRRLALVEAPDFGVPVTAVLAELDPAGAEDTLEELVDLGLLQSPYPGRYRFHDLVRLFARSRLSEEEPGARQRRARTRMDAWLLETATVAGRWFEPDYGAPPPDWSSLVELDTQRKAREWLTAEGEAWLAALREAARLGEHARVVEVAEAMHWFSDLWMHWGHWPEVFGLSAGSARMMGDRALEAVHLNYLSWAQTFCQARFGEAEQTALRALELARQSGDVRQQGWSLTYATWALWGRQDQQSKVTALEHTRMAAECFQRAGDADGLAQALAGIGNCLRRLGRLEEALEHSLAVIGRLRDPSFGGSPAITGHAVGAALDVVGESYLGLGRWQEAADHYRQALSELRGHPITRAMALSLTHLGRALVHLDQAEEAGAAFREAVELYESADDHARAAVVLGELDRLADHHAQAPAPLTALDRSADHQARGDAAHSA